MDKTSPSINIAAISMNNATSPADGTDITTECLAEHTDPLMYSTTTSSDQTQCLVNNALHPACSTSQMYSIEPSTYGTIFGRDIAVNNTASPTYDAAHPSYSESIDTYGTTPLRHDRSPQGKTRRATPIYPSHIIKPDGSIKALNPHCKPFVVSRERRSVPVRNYNAALVSPSEISTIPNLVTNHMNFVPAANAPVESVASVDYASQPTMSLGPTLVEDGSAPPFSGPAHPSAAWPSTLVQPAGYTPDLYAQDPAIHPDSNNVESYLDGYGMFSYIDSSGNLQHAGSSDGYIQANMADGMPNENINPGPSYN